MKTVCKKLLCLMLVAMMLVSAVPTAFAASCDIIMELHIDGEYQTEQPCTMEEGTPLDEGTIKLYAEQYVFPEYFTNAAYEYDGVGTGTTASAGARVVVRFKSVGCQHTDTVKGTINPTCTADGKEIVRCTNPECREIISETTLAKLGHNFVDGACTRCGEADPNATQTSNLVEITIFESDVDGNAKQVAVKKVDVDSYASMDAMVKDIYGKQFSSYRYRDFGDGTAQLVVYGVKTENGKAVYQLKVIHNNSTSDYTLIDIYEGEGILAAISNAGVAKKLKDMGKVIDDVEYKLVGFSINHTGNSKTSLNIHHTAEAEMVDAQGYIKVYADWEKKTDDNDDDYEFTDGTGGLYGDPNEDPIYDVVLYIYTNGKTSSYAKKVPASAMGTYTKDGILTRNEVQLVVQKYFKTSANTQYYGLFNEYYWNDGNYLTKNAETSYTLDPDNTNYIYVMVKNATAYVADSSNPKTGDYITVAATTMLLAAAALVSMFELKKRKMI